MASIETEVEIDVEDYLDEASDESLVDELESREYSLQKPIPFEFEYGYQLRDHLLEITRQGHHVSDEQLFEKLKSMMK